MHPMTREERPFCEGRVRHLRRSRHGGPTGGAYGRPAGRDGFRGVFRAVFRVRMVVGGA